MIKKTDICHINLSKGFRGGERQTELLIYHLSKENISQCALIRYDSPLKERLKTIPNLDIITIKKPYVFSLSKIRQCKILHAHETKAAQFSYISHIFYKKPYFITRRLDFIPKKNLFNKFMYTSAEKVFCISQSVKNSIEIVFPATRTQIIPSVHSNFNTTEKLETLKKRFKDYFVVGHIGALVIEHKGQDYILKAAENLKKMKNIKFVFVGNGKDKYFLESQAKKLRLNNVFFEGFRENIGDYLYIFDIFLYLQLFLFFL